MEGLMYPRFLLALACILIAAPPSFAQLSYQFKWQKGQIYNYKIKHVTSVVETLEKGTNKSESTLDLVNRWTVTDLDAKGVATLSLTLVQMRNEQKRANGDTLLFDSQNLDKSTPELREQMVKYIGQTVAVVRLDGFGRVLEVKQGNAANFDVEPPFVVVFPDAKAAVGQAWRRPINLVLEPPFGTGEKFELEQRYDCRKLDKGMATIGIKTEFKTIPDNARERLPLLQKEIEGEVVVDLQAGRLVSARLNIDKTVENHQGKGTSYQFKSQYVRDLAVE
jgi:hypothetical protein